MSADRSATPAAAGASGFTVIEVLVAFSVAAILSLTFLSVQHRAVEVASEYATSWQEINTAEEYFARRPFQETRRESPGWVEWEEDRSVRLRVDSDSLARLTVPVDERLAGVIDGGWTMRESLQFTVRLERDGHESAWEWVGWRY
ncbi:MAG: hypothetical protein H0S85_03920 [Desulfovibrionaceae bacterium]|jgi:type II secretory pathway component PulK|nr:hypothetical protein [Desulfovibrionaceae bacterium]